MRSGRFVKKRVYRTVVSVAFIKMAEGELPMAILPLVYRFLGNLMTTVAAISAAVTATAMIVTATTTATMAGVKFLFRGITYELDHTYVMQIFTG